MGNDYVFFIDGEEIEVEGGISMCDIEFDNENFDKQNEKDKKQLIYKKLIYDLVFEKRFEEAIRLLYMIVEKELITSELYDFLLGYVETKRYRIKFVGKNEFKKIKEEAKYFGDGYYEDGGVVKIGENGLVTKYRKGIGE